MVTVVLAFICALLVGALLTRGVRDLALARGWLDVAQSSRKVHTKPIPRVGGVAIVCGFFVALGVLLMADGAFYDRFRADARFAYAILGGGLVIALLGLYDDFVGARARQKFLVQFLVAAALCAAGLRVEVITNPFGDAIPLGLLSWPFTIIWVVGVINALNLIDGLDGLAGGVAFIGTGTSFVLALARGDLLMAGIAAALAGALLGFLIFNFNPASIFMGDTGSMFLGFVLAVASLRTASKSDMAVAMLIPVIALGLPIMDTLLAMARRSLVGRPMFSADKEHIHHRLMSRLRLSHRGTVLALYALSCFFAAIAVGLAFSNGAQSVMLLVSLATVSGLLLRRLGYLDRKALEQMVQTRKRNARLRRVVDGVLRQVAGATSLDSLWQSLQPLADALQVTKLELRPGSTANWPFNDLTLRANAPSEARIALQARVPVEWDGVPVGTLVAEWRDGRPEIVRDEELGLERVARFVARVIVRRNMLEVVVASPVLPEILLPSMRAAASGSSPRAVPGSRA